MDSETIANVLGNQWNYAVGEAKNRFVKLTETTLGENSPNPYPPFMLY